MKPGWNDRCRPREASKPDYSLSWSIDGPSGKEQDFLDVYFAMDHLKV